jgi:hypothetical protein
MLAYLIDEHPTIHKRAPLDVMLAASTPDEQGAQVAYEAAQQLAPECWTPSRRRQPVALASGLPA